MRRSVRCWRPSSPHHLFDWKGKTKDRETSAPIGRAHDPNDRSARRCGNIHDYQASSEAHAKTKPRLVLLAAHLNMFGNSGMHYLV